MRLRLHTFCLDVQKEGDRVTGIVIGGKSGMGLITGKVFVDASGDADLCFRAGAPFQPAGEDGPAQSLTTTFRLGNVDEERALKVKRADLVRMMKEANLSGEYRLPREEGGVHRTPLSGVVATNMTRVAYVDGTDPVELTKAEVEGRKQAMEYVRFLRERIPGYEQAYLINFSTQIGIRETRRVYGDCATEGARVVLFDIAAGALAETAAPTDAERVLPVVVDLTRPDAVEAAVTQAAAHWGRLDGVFNVAGGSGRRHGDGPVERCTVEGWRWTLDLNLTSVFLVCKYATPARLLPLGVA